MSIIALKGNDRAKRSRRGLTLIEAAMVLTIMALVVAGVMLFYQNASTSQKISSAAGQVSAVQQAVRAAYAGQPTYSGLSTAAIAGQLPTSMVVSGSTDLRNAFNGPITVGSHNGGGTDNSAFTITFSGLPAEACSRLAAVDMGRAALGIVVNNNGGLTLIPPVQPTVAQGYCGTNNNSSIQWILR